MSNSSSSASASVGFGWLGLLGVVLVILKLNPGEHISTDVVNWPWWVVLMPFWLGLAIFLSIVLFGAIGIALYTFLIEPLVNRRKRKNQRKRMQEMRKRRLEARHNNHHARPPF